jgi:hypothetical protein
MTRIGDLRKVDTPMVGINKELDDAIDQVDAVEAADVDYDLTYSGTTRPLDWGENVQDAVANLEERVAGVKYKVLAF